MTRWTTAVISSAIAMSSAALLSTPAMAASTVERTATCSTSAASIKVVFGVADDATSYGTLRSAQGIPEGEFSDTPVMIVRVHDGWGRLIVTRRSTDGSMSIAFARTIAGPNWTAEATVENTAAGSCTTPRVKIRA